MTDPSEARAKGKPSASSLLDNDADDPALHVDIVLARVEASLSADRLALASQPAIMAMLLEQGARNVLARDADRMSACQRHPTAASTLSPMARKMREGASKRKGGGRGAQDIHSRVDARETVLLSELVTKLNHRKKAQERVMMLTEHALYNYVPDSYRTVRRRIPLVSLSGVTVSEHTAEFVLHVEDAYDYHYRTHRRGPILHAIARRYRRLLRRDLPAEVVGGKDLGSLVMTKHAFNRQNALVSSQDTPGALTNTIRALVSQQKVRFQHNGFDLDLTYITTRVIAMGFPSDDFEGLYRNPYPEVFRFLETRHKNHYKVYNLCSERSYDAIKFHHRATSFPFHDHNPPPLPLMFDFCADLDRFLGQHPSNIAAIHCKAGKGRTGVMIACYMIWTGFVHSAKQALDFFAQRRTRDGEGVTIPSQRRFVRYFERIVRERIGPGQGHIEAAYGTGGVAVPPLLSALSLPLLPPRPFFLTEIEVMTVPHFSSTVGCWPFVRVHAYDGKLLFDWRDHNTVSHVSATHKDKDARDKEKEKKGKQDVVSIVFTCGVVVQGMLKVTLFDVTGFSGGEEEMCHVWIHTSMLSRAHTHTHRHTHAHGHAGTERTGKGKDEGIATAGSDLDQDLELDSHLEIGSARKGRAGDKGQHMREPEYETVTLRFSKTQIDKAVKDKKHRKFDKDFGIQFKLSRVPQPRAGLRSIVRHSPAPDGFSDTFSAFSDVVEGLVGGGQMGPGLAGQWSALALARRVAQLENSHRVKDRRIAELTTQVQELQCRLSGEEHARVQDLRDGLDEATRPRSLSPILAQLGESENTLYLQI